MSPVRWVSVKELRDPVLEVKGSACACSPQGGSRPIGSRPRGRGRRRDRPGPPGGCGGSGAPRSGTPPAASEAPSPRGAPRPSSASAPSDAAAAGGWLAGGEAELRRVPALLVISGAWTMYRPPSIQSDLLGSPLADPPISMKAAGVRRHRVTSIAAGGSHMVCDKSSAQLTFERRLFFLTINPTFVPHSPRPMVQKAG